MYSVLIAEDEILTQTGIRTCVPWESMDMHVVGCCSDGNSAWLIYQREQPDILITDIRMPGIDGLELIRRVRLQSKNTRIIIITCVEDFSIVQSILDKDITAYLLKASMTTEDILCQLAKAKAQLDGRTENDLSIAPHAKRQTLRNLLRGYVIDHTISLQDFRKSAAEFFGDLHSYGSLALLRLPEAAASAAAETTQNLLEQNLNILGSSVILALENGFLIFVIEPTEIGFLNSCLKGIMSTLEGSLHLRLRAVVCSEGLNDESLPSVCYHCNRILDMPFFYPENLYDLAPGASHNPANEKEMLYRFAEHPICKGIASIGCSRLENALKQMQDAFAKDRELFVQAAMDVANVLAFHFNIPEQEQMKIRTAPSATAVIALLAGFMPKYNRHPIYGKVIDQATEYLCANFSKQSVKLSDLADLCNFSVSYFALMLRQNIGVSFTEFLSILRMEKACHLLETTRMSIHKVSDCCGFASVSYFTRYFSTKAHCSPKEWRKRHCSV